MTFKRDLALKTLDSSYESSIALYFARYALGLNYEMLPEDVVHQAKRCLLDALGVAIGGYDAPGRPICEAMASELGGPEEATLFGSGHRTSILNATLVNGFMLRYLDYMDLGGGGHNSEAIPSLLAVSERSKIGGRDFLTSLVISYELGARVHESLPNLGGKWRTNIRGGLNMPPALGKLMGLNAEQIANAMGICASHSLPLGILDNDKEELTMTKNVNFSFVAQNAVVACMLAKKGFTGPMRIVEGDKGFSEVIAQGEMNLERLKDLSGWLILKTRFKPVCANGTTIPHILATLAVVKEHDLKVEDVKSVRITAGPREARHTTSLAKKYPRNGETADHSAFYANAIAIKERAFGPESFKPENFTDPTVLDLIERITVEADPNMEFFSYSGVSEITTKDGRKLQKRIDGIPHLSDEDLEKKFREMALKHMSREQTGELIDTVWNVESLMDMSQLTRLMTFQEQR
jgi:2-methylcitrate dehydratase